MAFGFHKSHQGLPSKQQKPNTPSISDMVMIGDKEYPGRYISYLKELGLQETMWADFIEGTLPRLEGGNVKSKLDQEVQNHLASLEQEKERSASQPVSIEEAQAKVARAKTRYAAACDSSTALHQQLVHCEKLYLEIVSNIEEIQPVTDDAHQALAAAVLELEKVSEAELLTQKELLAKEVEAIQQGNGKNSTKSSLEERLQNLGSLQAYAGKVAMAVAEAKTKQEEIWQAAAIARASQGKRRTEDPVPEDHQTDDGAKRHKASDSQPLPGAEPGPDANMADKESGEAMAENGAS